MLFRSLFQEVIPNLPYLKAEILYAVTHEGARSIDDVFSRRTRIAFEAPDQGLSVIDNVADLIAPHLGWSATQKTASIQEYRAIVERQNTELQTLKKSNSKVS